MKTVLNLLAFTVISAAPVLAGPIYGAGSNGDLYTVNPATGATVEVGAMGTTMYDIAEYDNALYGISGTSALYSINTSTGHATEIGTGTGDALDALTFNNSGILYAAGVSEDTLYTINLTSGLATSVPGETNTTAYNAAGDLQFLNGNLYMTTGGSGSNAPSTLVTVNLTTGNMTTDGAIKVGSTAVDDVFGLVDLNNVLYGFTSPSGTGEVITLNTTTGAATNVATYGGGSFTFYGTTSDPVPEPGTLGVMMLGLAGLGAALYRRRKA